MRGRDTRPVQIMIRFLFRTLALICFAIAIMFVVIDATRSIGVSGLELTPFGESFEFAAPQLFEALNGWVARSAPDFVTDDVVASLMAIPTFAVFAVVAFLLYAIGRKPRSHGLQRPRGR